MRKELILEIVTALLVLLFLYTSFSKLFEFAAFERAMYNQPFPHWFSALLIWTLPAVEIIVAIALFFPKTRLYGLYAFFLLMVLFTAYITAILLHFFPRVPCTCGGVIRALGWVNHLFFNLVFIALAGIALLINRRISTFRASYLKRINTA